MILDKLQQYFEEDKNVILAFIFGSVAKGSAGEDSDLDIAVYLKNENDEDRIWLELCRIGNSEVDLIVLNNAPASLVSNIFKTGTPLVIKDRKLYLDIYLKSSLEAEDFLEFAKDYHKIFSRSGSLIPEDRVRLLEIINFLKSEFQEIEFFHPLTYEEYLADKIKRRNIERWVENIINCTIDIAKIILASEKKEMPKTYEQALFTFGIHIGMKEEEADNLSSFACLKNILAHEYLDIIFQRIKKFMNESPPLYKKIFE
ncbi:MAG: type VII toxin-antitoxin system MntA family adenylyltransferase antitoxin [Thermodesulfobacteriota bacterium]